MQPLDGDSEGIPPVVVPARAEHHGGPGKLRALAKLAQEFEARPALAAQLRDDDVGRKTQQDLEGLGVG